MSGRRLKLESKKSAGLLIRVAPVLEHNIIGYNSVVLSTQYLGAKLSLGVVTGPTFDSSMLHKQMSKHPCTTPCLGLYTNED